MYINGSRSNNNSTATQDMATTTTTTIKTPGGNDGNSKISLSSESEYNEFEYPLLNGIKKIAISSGNVELIKADAIVVPFSVQMRPSSSCTSVILKHAGSKATEELQLVKEHERCEHSKRFHTTQTVDITGGALNVKKIIGVVTPSYSKKYDTALVSALTNCFTNTLTRAVDVKAKTIAFAGMFDSVCCAGYDRALATHIGLQACKNFLTKYGHKFDYVLFFALNPEELSILQQLMPLYFPRNLEEQAKSLKSLDEMKAKLGGKGGAFSRERKMRVTAMPGGYNNSNTSSSNDNKSISQHNNNMSAIDRVESSYTLTSYSPIHESIQSYNKDNKTPNPTPVKQRSSKLRHVENNTKIKICRAWKVHSVHSKNGSEYIAYEMNVTRSKKPETKIFRRFSECRDMYNKILDLAYTLGDGQTLRTLRNAEFPSRTFWVSNFDQTVIDERLSKLPKIFKKILNGTRTASPRVKREVEDFLSSMRTTDHDMMCVLKAQEELQKSIKEISTTSALTSAKEDNNNKDANVNNVATTSSEETTNVRKFGNILTNKTTNRISNVAKPKKKNSSKKIFEEEEEEEKQISWDKIEKQHKQLKQRRKQLRNTKTFLRKVKIVTKKSSSGSFDGEGNRFITNESL